jgi:hypothetical protein
MIRVVVSLVAAFCLLGPSPGTAQTTVADDEVRFSGSPGHLKPGTGATGAAHGDEVSGGVQTLNLLPALERASRPVMVGSMWTAASTTQTRQTVEPGWIRRHPVLFGALVGAGAGMVTSIPRWTELYCAGGGDEDCLFHGASGVAFGAAAGAGIGALVGAIAGR